MAEKKTNARTLSGRVVSDKMNKTRVVAVQKKIRHPLYGKFVSKTTKVHAHDENNSSKVGDLVVVRETRPISKTKSWTLVETVKSGALVQEPETTEEVLTSIETPQE